MNSCTIYTPISSIMCSVTCFEQFCRFRLYKLKTCEQKIILRPSGSKKIAKISQNDTTQAQHGKYRGRIQCNEKPQKRKGTWAVTSSTMGCLWGLPQPWRLPRVGHGDALFPRSACFLRGCSDSYAFCCEFMHKSRFWLLLLGLPPPPCHPTYQISLFRLDQRERERGESCKDFMPSLRSKDSSAILAQHFFSFSSLFSN